MDSDVKCNRLSCRKTLVDKAVVVGSKHCIPASHNTNRKVETYAWLIDDMVWPTSKSCNHEDRLAYILRGMRQRVVQCVTPLSSLGLTAIACETSLTEPYVLCIRQTTTKRTEPDHYLGDMQSYQIHQENSFQQAVTRNLNDKNAQLHKQLENVIREANGEINLLGNKVAELERDLELERRKVRELQDASREREKEYQKLKAQHDKVKRKALLAPDPPRPVALPGHGLNQFDRAPPDNQTRPAVGEVDIGAVVGGMEAIGIQRTPLISRTMPGSFGMQQGHPRSHAPQSNLNPQARTASLHRHPLNTGDRSFRVNSVSDRSDSANEVENMLLPQSGRGRHTGVSPGSGGWGTSSARSHLVQGRT
ncbi:hypothetical protein BU15DRAFT_57942 [Melanogaster broomeanus]|nr:hypothetical protein BU15DRAFT_57942 [Melanogaster broomeanus]